MKISSRLSISYLAIILLMLIVGIIGYNSLSKLNTEFDSVVNEKYQNKIHLENIKLRLTKLMMLNRDIIMDNRPEKIDEILKYSAVERVKNDSDYKFLETHVLDPKGKELYNQIIEVRKVYQPKRKELTDLAKANKLKEATKILFDELTPIAIKYEAALMELENYIDTQMNEGSYNAFHLAEGAKSWILYIIGFAILIAVAIAYVITLSITKPIARAVKAAEDISKGNFKIDLKTDKKDETGKLLKSLEKMSNTIKFLINDINDLSGHAIEGKLDKRADDSSYEGDYKVLVKGMNDTLDAIITPLNLTAEYVDRISKGDIPPKISDEYKGDYNEIKNNINQMIDTLQAFVGEIREFNKYQMAGEIEYFMNENHFNGVYRQMCAGANEAVKLHIDNILLILGLLGEYSEGNFKNNLKLLPGKQIIANQILDKLKDNVVSVIQAINKTAGEQESGDIEAVIDTKDFSGAFLEMCLGFNSCIQQIHGSIGKILTMTGEYADGNFSQILEPLPGKQVIGNITLDKLRNNVLSVISAINETSAKQAAGDIDSRIDSSKFQGAFKEMSDGYNECVNTLGTSIIKILNVSKEYSKGNFEVELENLPGKLSMANDTLNELRNNFLNVESEISKLIEAASLGDLSVRADHLKFEASYQKIVQGLNLTLDNVITPLNLAAEYIDSISSGNIPAKINAEYKGDFNKIKNNLNNLIDTLHGVLGQTGALIRAANEGNLKLRGDSAKFTGVWKTVVDDINTMIQNTEAPINELSFILDKITLNDYSTNMQEGKKGVWNDLTISTNNVIARLLSVQNIMQEVANGDLKQLHDFRIKPQRSENDKLRPAVLGMMKSVQKLLDDANGLANSFISGKLDYRPNPDDHKGEFANVISGVNQTVDTLVYNVKFMLNFLKQVSAGDELNIIDENLFAGEYKNIPLAINKLRNFLYAMIDDTTGAAAAALNGNLNARIDVNKYPGGWNVIVKGFNESLDVLINQFNIALNFLKAVSNGDDLSVIDESEYKGEYRNMISNMNRLRNFLYAMIDDTAATAQEAVHGNLSTRIDLSRYPGGWSIITGGFNNTLEALVVPVEQAIKTLETLATGDLTAKMTGEYQGDFKRIQFSINQLSETLSTLIRQIVSGVENTANSSNEISKAADRMATSTHEQSAQTEEIASAVEQMSRTINENAHHAVKTSGIAQKSGSVANEGKVIVEETIHKMKDIAEVVRHSAENIEKLGESSKQIGEIISVIDDIADQTNLLALNAAIEAARAGEQGRGFAVVADEVRKLAERTTDATKKIAQMINSIQKETDDAVKVMKNGNTEVSEGILLADKAGEALNLILQSAKEVIDMITQIASANEEQAATSEQLAQNIANINQVTSDFAQKIQEIATSSEGLTSLTDQLRNAVEQFKIDEVTLNERLLVGNKPYKKNLLR